MSDDPYLAVMRDEAMNGPRSKRVNNLDEKLKKIRMNIYYDTHDGRDAILARKEACLGYEQIAEIKQAFHENGYRWLPKQHDIQSLVDEGLAEFQMTGQEWYDRFEKHFNLEFKLPVDFPVLTPQEIKRAVSVAARKAANLDEA